MAWTTPRTWVTGEVVTASHMNTHVRDNMNETAPGKASAAGLVLATAANTIAVRTISTNDVQTLETTSSASYTDLSTSGPAVTLTTGTQVLVVLAVRVSSATLGVLPSASYAVSGSSSSSASNTKAYSAEMSAANDIYSGTFASPETGLTAGSNTFTMKYANLGAAGTASFAFRRITVLPLN